MADVAFEVDFNDIDGDGRLWASVRYAHGLRFPEPGERVTAHDDEGNRCEGIVHAVDGPIVEIALDLDTWTHGSLA